MPQFLARALENRREENFEGGKDTCDTYVKAPGRGVYREKGGPDSGHRTPSRGRIDERGREKTQLLGGGESIVTTTMRGTIDGERRRKGPEAGETPPHT